MADKTYTIPTPPEFPASNRSYNVIVTKMHDAAIAAASAEAAMTVIDHLKDTIGGVNTYAKAVRRYADDIRAAIVNASPKHYKTLSAAKTAVTKAGLDTGECTFVEAKGGFCPTFPRTSKQRGLAITAGFATTGE
jgi:hypothetical protein